MLQLLVVLLCHYEPHPDIQDETVYDQCSDVGYKLCSYWMNKSIGIQTLGHGGKYFPRKKGHLGKTNCSIANVPLLSIWTL